MKKDKIIKILNEIGMFLEFLGESPFKYRAYYNGARILSRLDISDNELKNKEKLKEINGIGDALSKKISTLAEKDYLEYYERIKSKIPQSVIEMLKVPGLSPKKVKAIYENLKIDNIKDLKNACLEDKLISLPNFGEKVQAKILKAIELYENGSKKNEK